MLIQKFRMCSYLVGMAPIQIFIPKSTEGEGGVSAVLGIIPKKTDFLVPPSRVLSDRSPIIDYPSCRPLTDELPDSLRAVW